MGRAWIIVVLVAGAFLTVGFAPVAPWNGPRLAATTTTTLGMTSLTPNAGTADTLGQGIPVFQGDAAGGYVLAAPAAGTITSWSFLSAGIAPGTTFVLRVLRPAGTDWTAVATSSQAQVTTMVGVDAVNGPFATNLPIAAGDRIALQPVDGVSTPIEPGVNGQDGIRFFAGPVADGTTAAVAPASTMDNGQIVPVQATVQSNPAPTLTVSLAGSGSGSVAGDGSPAISCPGACAQQYAGGTTVTLTASAASGSTFTGWSGGGCSGTGTTCAVALGADTAVTATFDKTGPVPLSLHGPRVDGTPKAGQTLLCNGDTWTTFGKAFFTYTWFETTASRTAHGPVVRATAQVATGPSRSFVVPDYAPGATVFCTATATNANGSSAPAAATPVTVLATPPVLSHSSPGLGIFPSPTIGPSVDSHLNRTSVCQPGTWAHHPTAYRYDWYALPGQHSALSAGRPVGTGATLAITQAVEAQWLVCRVTASNQAGQGVALSNRYYVSAPDFGVHVNAIEITQGVQTTELPTRSATNPTAYHVTYNGVNLPWQAAGAAPVTVALAEDHVTVVRVYVNTQIPLGRHEVPTMVLRAFRGGRELAPGPIAPDQVPPKSAVPGGGKIGDAVAPAQRYSATGAYTFTLPRGSATADDWTTGDVTFEAQANPDATSTPPCSLSCEERTLFLDGVHFNRVTSAQIDPLAFFVTTAGGTTYPQGYPGVDPSWVETQAVTPFPLYINPYKIVYNATTTINPASGFSYKAASQTLLALVQNWANDNDTLSSHYPFAIVPSGFQYGGGLTQGGGRILYGDAQPRSVASENRPLTAMAHEMNHGLGLVHAGTECGSGQDQASDAIAPPKSADSGDDLGQVGEAWPPVVASQDGAFDGVGLDTSLGYPYPIIPPSTAANPIFDLMSYCGSTADGTFASTRSGLAFVVNPNVDHWISVRNWNRDVAFRAPGPLAVASAGQAPAYRTSPPATAGATRSLAVTALWDVASGRTTITDVAADTGAPTAAGSDATYSLVGRDATGRIVATAGATAAVAHIDRAAPVVLINGKIAAAGVSEVDVLQNGRPVAQDRASAHAPTVSLLSPGSGQRLGGPHGAVLRWHSGDADGDKLQVTIRFSPDGGRSWTTIYVGPDTGEVNLPSGLLGASRHAEVRTYVSDGFNEAITTSRPFVSVGAPPVVSITSPHRATRVTAGGTLDLAGTAYDDSGKRLSGRALTWRAGHQVIGRGANAVSVNLPAGHYSVTLTARDRRGRTTTASVPVIVTPAPPVVRLLRLPQRVSPTARSLTLQIASLAPATLTVGRAHAVVGRTPRRVRIPITPGHGALVLEIGLRSGRFATVVPVRVTR